MKKELKSAILRMKERIIETIGSCRPTIYLYGSIVLDDFKFGWSDIDILVLTETAISNDQAGFLVKLRQRMISEEPDNRFYRSFEGGILSKECFISGEPDTVVYWGTSGQRLMRTYNFDSFCMVELLENGILLYGEELRQEFNRPKYMDLVCDVKKQYDAIRRYAKNTGRDLYSFGWLLDISRCIYTLRTGKIIAKTLAGEWALNEKICPCVEALANAISVRRNPEEARTNSRILDYAETLGDEVQHYADVLEFEISLAELRSMRE